MHENYESLPLGILGVVVLVTSEVKYIHISVYIFYVQ